jgi:hypothetical protein
MMIAYVSIGNSDDKLTQAEWAEFHGRTSLLLRDNAHIHGQWVSEPASAWQNACWCIDIELPATAAYLKNRLSAFAKRYRQDSIAWAEVRETEFLEARGAFN